MAPQNNNYTSNLEDPTDYNVPSSDQNTEQPVNNRSSSSSLFSGIKSVAFDVSSYWAKKFYDAVLLPRDPRAYYKHLLDVASNYEQWSEAAKILDQLEGKDQWKNDAKSPDYDYDLLQQRLQQLKKARKSGDLSHMTFLLKTSLARNLADMGQPKLYAYTHIGTKKLIENYIAEVVKQMNIICDTESDDISTKDKLEFFINTRQSFGRTALLLSGGATFGLAHIGVIKCLYECKLLPRIISGASSGSIFAAILCTKTDDEIPETLRKLSSTGFHLEVFERSSTPETWLIRINRFLKQGVLFDADILTECMRHNIPDMTFQEAYNRTRRILNITVSTSTVYEMPRLLNYLTAPDVLIWSAVAASCSVPGIYNSVQLMAKDKTGKVVPWNPSGHRWIDGSVENDLPMNRLSELFNVNHFIVCQVNPHVVPFLHKNLIPSTVSRLVGWFLFFAISELEHRLTQLSEFGVMPSLLYRTKAIMSQRYYGDITIVPNISYTDFFRILSNPTPEVVQKATLRGERATWPKISIIRNHCQIELTLDEIVYRLRRRQLGDSFPTRNSEELYGLDLETQRTESIESHSQQLDNHGKQRHKIQPLSTTNSTKNELQNSVTTPVLSTHHIE
ncbi:patatin-domain-containing protein [Gigaspora margarita]|uniref:Patatin-domain-containing protein n=1 Tax=Gigaspora margarita TaxID=4874 RepID=A0A8H4AJ24_GIGMA|nr:patatin-domain-containing protein [Gigaspora margarita]